MQVEFLSSKGFGIQDGEFRYIAIAIDKREMPTFWIHESDWRRCQTDAELRQYVASQALSVEEQEQELLTTQA